MLVHRLLHILQPHSQDIAGNLQFGWSGRFLRFKSVSVCTSGYCLTTAACKQATRFETVLCVQCHGEYGDLAGWVVPVAKMLAKQLVTQTGDDQEDDLDIVQNFFETSCAPSNNPDQGEVCSACDGTVRLPPPLFCL